MVRQMVLDEMRRGDFSNVSVRVSRIEELVRQGLLERKDERRLILLAARFLEAAGETKKAFRLTGQLLADEDTLSEDLLIDLRRFRTRLLLNIGKIEDARAEVQRIERVVMSKDGSFGMSVESIEEDSSRVTVPTWLLTAEVCLAEGKITEASESLGLAFESMKQQGHSAEDGAVFELLSAVLCFQSGDDTGIPALAYLYRVHVVLESGVDAAIRARIASAAGHLESVSGISGNEAERWSSYGPDRTLVAKYLNEGEGVVPPSDLLKRILPAEVLSSDPVTEMTVVTRPQLRERLPINSSSVPLSFDFESFALEEISSMLDFNMKTGPLVVDWSACDKAIIEEAIAAKAISEVARHCTSGTIYFNNGSYVDASFEGAEGATSGASVLETIFELFRIGMARLPGAFGYQAMAGATAARVPEIVNLRPNKVNIDLMKKLDHLRSGVVEEEDENVDALFDQWQESSPASAIASDADATALAVEVRPDSGFVTKLGSVMEAEEVEQIVSFAAAALTDLGVEDPKIDFFVMGAKGSLTESGTNDESLVVAEERSAGAVTARLSLAPGATVNCRDAVRALLNACARRVRTVSGSSFEGRIDVPDFIAADPVTQSVLSTLRDFAALDGMTERRKLKHILLVGERGSGKEKLARLVHEWSGRAKHPFVAVNFGAITKELAAAELFGAKKGSYTGSVADRRGYIQQAGRGTLFLDELDEASESMQALIKRVVQFGVFNIVGEATESKADTRFVAATNVVDVQSLAIKQDLKDRFLVLRVPPLRERRGDIRPLAERVAAECGYRLPEPALAFLERLDWPGNVRQLQNVVERSCAVATVASDLTLGLVQRSATDDGLVVSVASGMGGDFVPLRVGESLEARLGDEEKRHVIYALDSCKGNRTHAAAQLGITRQSLLAKIKKFELEM